MRITVLVLLLWHTHCPAKDADGEFAVFSVGANSCKDYLQAGRQKPREFARYVEWMQGYLSAFNLIVVNTYNILGNRDDAQALKWLNRYCARNPAASFINAVAVMTVQLYPERRNLSPAGNINNDNSIRHKDISAGAGL